MITVFHWIGQHSNKLAGVARAFFYMGILLTWWHWTAEQLAAVMTFIEALLYVFVESNTVSKARVGERITEKVDEKMAEIMESGVYTKRTP